MKTKAEELSKCLQDIRAYTSEHLELVEAHHFLFDLRHCEIDQVRFVIMGQNPGEPAHDREIVDRGEESSESDFRSSEAALRFGRPPRAKMKWAKLAASILEGNDFVQTERFFWSSANLNEAFVERFKSCFEDSKHLDFCNKINKRLIDAYRPEAIICPGLSGMEYTVRAFDLTLVSSTIERGKRLVIHYTDPVSRTWFFTPNWTGSFGFSQQDRNTITATIRAKRLPGGI